MAFYIHTPIPIQSILIPNFVTYFHSHTIPMGLFPSRPIPIPFQYVYYVVSNINVNPSMIEKESFGSA